MTVRCRVVLGVLLVSVAAGMGGAVAQSQRFVLPAAGGNMTAGPYTCTTSIGTVDGAVFARGASFSVQGGFICVEPNYALACNSDLDDSGLVDTGDMAVLLMLFGPTLPPFRFADLDSSGWINLGDLAILLLNYGEQCGPAASLRAPSVDEAFDRMPLDVPGGEL